MFFGDFAAGREGADRGLALIGFQRRERAAVGDLSTGTALRSLAAFFAVGGGGHPVAVETAEAAGFHKRRRRLTETIEWLLGAFAADCPGHTDPVVLLDSTPVECGRSAETVRRSELADACGYGYCRSHSRWFWGMRLHLCCAPDGTPRASILAPADQPEREVALRLLPQALHGGEQIVCDKGYAGREFAAEVESRFAAEVLRPSRKDEPDSPVHLAMIRQRVESVFWTLKDRLGLERHRARTLAGLRARIASKLLALAAGVWVNTLLGLPSRSFARFAA